MSSAQYGLMTGVIAAILIGFVTATGATPADFINSALMTVTPVLATLP